MLKHCAPLVLAGGISSLSAAVSVFIPVSAPIVGPIAAVSTAVSVGAGIYAILMDCSNGNTSSCVTAAVSSTISVFTSTGRFAKKVKELGVNARSPLQTSLKPREYAKVNAERMLDKFKYSAITSSSSMVDIYGRVLNGLESKGDYECK